MYCYLTLNILPTNIYLRLTLQACICMNTITRVLHSIFNHRKDIVYRLSSSILISAIRISYRKINLYECPFSIQRRIGLGVAYVAKLVKVSGSSLGKLFILDFFILNKKQARRAQGTCYDFHV